VARQDAREEFSRAQRRVSAVAARREPRTCPLTPLTPGPPDPAQIGARVAVGRHYADGWTPLDNWTSKRRSNSASRVFVNRASARSLIGSGGLLSKLFTRRCVRLINRDTKQKPRLSSYDRYQLIKHAHAAVPHRRLAWQRAFRRSSDAGD
jgi:hypothetical protein